MSRMKDVMIDLQEAVARGNLSFSEIASLYGVPLNWVYLALTEVLEQAKYMDEDTRAFGDLLEEHYETE